MKRIITFFLFFVSSVTVVFSQEYSFHYGKVTKDELAMTTYQKDSAASAIAIYKTTDASYEYYMNDFILVYNYETKIKVLKSEGTEYANITIPFYNKASNGTSKEIVSKIEAYSYNIENGKVVKTKMDKSYIFEEQINANWKQIKFSIPAVKVGTVIEYKYKLSSDFYTQISDWILQQSIPVVYANYEIRIPEYFHFNIETRSQEPIKTEDTQVNQSFNVDSRAEQNSVPIICTSRRLVVSANDLPALKDEPNVWCVDDYRAQVNFDLKGVQFPNSLYKPYTTTWEKIDELLKEKEDFGEVLKLKNPFREEMHAMNLSSLTPTEKIRTLFQFLKTKISWNEKYNFYGKDIKKAIKDGSGSNADINFVYISMLKDAGLKAFPVLMSTRSQGRLPYTHPSIDKLSTFIVGIHDTDSTTVYLDGSVKNGDINILPPVLMVDRARTYNEGAEGQWVDLTNVGRHSINATIIGSISPEGIIKGERNVFYIGENAASFRDAFKAAKDSATFIEKAETEDDISIKGCKYNDLNSFSSCVKETLSFTKKATSNDGHIYLNPMIFPHLTKNQFTKEERKLPIEFDYPYTFKLTCALTLPDGYQVEETPKPVKINLANEGCSCIYRIQKTDNQILLLYTFSLSRIIYTKDEYSALRQLWGAVTDKNNELVVLKKTVL